MMYVPLCNLSGILLFVTACSSISTGENGGIPNGTSPESELVALNADGSLPDQNFTPEGTGGRVSRLVTNNGVLSGYRYAYGRVIGTSDFLGVAGIAPTSNPGAPITMGSVSYDGTYDIAHIDDTTTTQQGDISLIASFDQFSLTGAADGVTVDGTFSGTTLNGTVTAFGVTADLEGVVGESRTVGAFAGDSDNALLVGGFFADAVN